MIGKSLNFIRSTMGEPFYSSGSKQTLEYGDLQRLVFSIDSTYTIVSRHLLQTLFEKYKLEQTLLNLKKYLLLGQGDFVGYLMDSLG